MQMKPSKDLMLTNSFDMERVRKTSYAIYLIDKLLQ